MQISARVHTTPDSHVTTVSTDGTSKAIPIPAREGMPGSSVNGGEVLSLALATCFGNDLFREAKTSGIDIVEVEVIVESEFGGRGEPTRSIGYRVRVAAKASEAAISDLIRLTDEVAEVHNTIRLGLPVTLESFEAISV